MYAVKLTRKEKEDKFFRLKRLKDELEFDNNPKREHPESKRVIVSWKAFLKLPYSEQEKIRKEWDQYYAEVKLTPIYLMLQAQKEAYRTMISKSEWPEERNKAKQRFTELAKESRLMRENGDDITLPKPKSIDPWEYDKNWVKAYKDCEKAISDLNQEMNNLDEEAQSVWGGQS